MPLSATIYSVSVLLNVNYLPDTGCILTTFVYQFFGLCQAFPVIFTSHSILSQVSNRPLPFFSTIPQEAGCNFHGVPFPLVLEILRGNHHTQNSPKLLLLRVRAYLWPLIGLVCSQHPCNHSC